MLQEVIQNVYDVIVLVVLFGVTIFVHEFGHFLAALKLGLVVETFSIGFGPAIWKKKIKGITYKVAWVPFGGYVALPQLDPAAMSVLQGEPDENGNVKGGLPPIRPWRKIVVSVAGPFGNVLFGVLLAWIIYLSPEAQVGASSTSIGQVSTNSVAYAVGLRPGDNVVAVNGESVGTWYRFSEECVLRAGESNRVTLTVEYLGERRNVTVPIAEEIRGQVIDGLERAEPCLFGVIQPGGSAEAAGLRIGDILKELDGIPVVSCEHLDRIGKGKEGRTVPVTVERDGEAVHASVKLPVTGVEPADPCIIGAVIPGRPAHRAGIRARDVVKEFNGTEIVSWEHFRRTVGSGTTNSVPIVVERGGELLTLTVTPEYNKKYKRILVGAAPGIVPVVPWMRYKEPMAQVKGDAMGIVRILRALTTPGQARNAAGAIGGPVMIMLALWTSIKTSMLNAVGFLRFLNINLAILNLLPIPVLDGGHIVIALWEWLTRRKAHAKLVNALTNVFAVLLILLMLVITFRDIRRFFGLPDFLKRKPAAESSEDQENQQEDRQEE